VSFSNEPIGHTNRFPDTDAKETGEIYAVELAIKQMLKELNSKQKDCVSRALLVEMQESEKYVKKQLRMRMGRRKVEDMEVDNISAAFAKKVSDILEYF